MIYDSKSGKYLTKEELLANKNTKIDRKSELFEKTNELLEQILNEIKLLNNNFISQVKQNEQSSK